MARPLKKPAALPQEWVALLFTLMVSFLWLCMPKISRIWHPTLYCLALVSVAAVYISFKHFRRNRMLTLIGISALVLAAADFISWAW
ncbi:MAG: hypothetical protein KF784_14905 [Fimbriimonadaceae bacterium]|nr:hypothetical protein [Fimbriimonadaceae bacterium]